MTRGEEWIFQGYQGVVRTSGADLGLEYSVVVLRMVHWWPAFDPLFFLGGEAQFRDQDNSVALMAPNKFPLKIFFFKNCLGFRECTCAHIPP